MCVVHKNSWRRNLGIIKKKKKKKKKRDDHDTRLVTEIKQNNGKTILKQNAYSSLTIYLFLLFITSLYMLSW
jgi:hypothetical protein